MTSNISHIVRVWKDETYRLSLSEEELSQLPANPAGMIELSDADLEGVSAAARSQGSSSCCSTAASACCG